MGDCVLFSSGEDSNATRPSHQTWLDAPPLRRARVLLVDDSKHDIILAKHFLLGPGGLDCDLMTAQSTAEALDVLLKAQAGGRPVDLILLDISMPGDGGFVCLRRIRDHPALRGTPVVMCTGSALDIDRSRARHLGIVGYMVKPPSPGTLRDIVECLPFFEVEDEGAGIRLMTVIADRPS
jgi:two-component system chemotaxis response regulator CheY